MSSQRRDSPRLASGPQGGGGLEVDPKVIAAMAAELHPPVTPDRMCHDLAMDVLREMEFVVPRVPAERKAKLTYMIHEPMMACTRNPQVLMHPEVLDPLMELLASLAPPERYFVLCQLEQACLR